MFRPVFGFSLALAGLCHGFAYRRSVSGKAATKPIDGEC